jgi:hypothetical protein
MAGAYELGQQTRFVSCASKFKPLSLAVQPTHLSRRVAQVGVLPQSPAARKALEAGTKIELTLGVPPKRRHKYKR